MKLKVCIPPSMFLGPALQSWPVLGSNGITGHLWRLGAHRDTLAGCGFTRFPENGICWSLKTSYLVTPWSKYMAQSPKGRLIQGLYKSIHGNSAIYFCPGVSLSNTGIPRICKETMEHMWRQLVDVIDWRDGTSLTLICWNNFVMCAFSTLLHLSVNKR